jgi:hypothetical protein
MQKEVAMIRQLADVKEDLHQLGADEFDLLLPETHALLDIIHDDELIVGIVYGRYKQNNAEHASGRGALVATNNRLLLVDKKPMFLKCDELSYNVVSGVSYSKAGIAGTVTVHSRTGDISIRTYNFKCAGLFVEAIETRCLSKSTQPGLTNIL